jgi:hypothetical protein
MFPVGWSFDRLSSAPSGLPEAESRGFEGLMRLGTRKGGHDLASDGRFQNIRCVPHGKLQV